MKVIVANYRYFIAGGPEKYMFKFIEAAQKRKIEIIPFSIENLQNEETPYSKYFAKPRSKQLMYSETKKTFGNIIGMIRATVWNYDAEYRLRKLIRYTKPDAIYILHEINHLSPSIIRAASKEGIRVVHRISDFFMFCPKYDFLCDNEICEACMHGDYSKAIKKRCVKDSKIGTIFRVLAMKLYKKIKIFDQVDKFVCTCNFTKQKLIEGGIDKDKIICVPTFIDASKIKPCYKHNNYFLFLGRLAHQKGAIYAIKAIEQLKDSDYILKISGTITNNEYDQELWKYIQEHGLEHKVDFVGFKKGKELEELIEESTCIVCPAIWYENMPNTVIEAYAYGKPVVASRVGSLEEIVEDGKTGFLFEMKNHMDFAKKLRLFIDNPELSRELGMNARKKCLSLYNEELHMNKIINILKSDVKK